MDYPFFFTWTAQHAVRPLELTGGEGAWFTTADGARWLDLGALAYHVNAGHGRKRIVEAIKRQADQLDRELAARKLSLHVEPGRGSCIIAPPLCITRDELIAGLRGFGDAAVAAFGGRAGGPAAAAAAAGGPA